MGAPGTYTASAQVLGRMIVCLQGAHTEGTSRAYTATLGVTGEEYVL